MADKHQADRAPVGTTVSGRPPGVPVRRTHSDRLRKKVVGTGGNVPRRKVVNRSSRHIHDAVGQRRQRHNAGRILDRGRCPRSTGQEERAKRVGQLII